MVRRHRAKYVVLCEDQQSQVFIVRVLRELGVQSWEIRRVPLPSESGGGAGEQYVRGRYAAEVKAARDQKRKSPLGLVVHIDADPTHTVEERHTQLAEVLREAGEKPRQRGEPIAELVPKRNIETWVHALDESLSPGLGRPLDEAQAYPKLEYPSEGARAAQVFAEHVRQGTEPVASDVVPSLRDGLTEFRRLP